MWSFIRHSAGNFYGFLIFGVGVLGFVGLAFCFYGLLVLFV